MWVVISSSCENENQGKNKYPKNPIHCRSSSPSPKRCSSSSLSQSAAARHHRGPAAPRCRRRAGGGAGIRRHRAPYHRIHCHCISQPPFPLPWSSPPLLLCLASRSLPALEEDKLRSLPLLPLPTPPPPPSHLGSIPIRSTTDGSISAASPSPPLLHWLLRSCALHSPPSLPPLSEPAVATTNPSPPSGSRRKWEMRVGVEEKNKWAERGLEMSRERGRGKTRGAHLVKIPYILGQIEYVCAEDIR